MPLIREAFLLFALNLLDALLTVVWVRNGVAAEGNQLMAKLLDTGDFTFFAVKIGIGALAALVILNWSQFRMARFGISAAIGIYLGLMGIHLFTGLSAFGYISANFVHDVASWSPALFSVVL